MARHWRNDTHLEFYNASSAVSPAARQPGCFTPLTVMFLKTRNAARSSITRTINIA
jgi:hypothetical protein